MFCIKQGFRNISANASGCFGISSLSTRSIAFPRQAHCLFSRVRVSERRCFCCKNAAEKCLFLAWPVYHGRRFAHLMPEQHALGFLIGGSADMERYNGSEHRKTETYMMQAVDANPHISATPLVEEIDIMDNEAAPDFMVDQGLYYPAASYYGYYCTGFESPGEWDDQNRFLGLDNQDLQYSGLQAESLPYIYYTPSYGYAQSPYNPYNPYIPGAVIGADGQLVGTQQYYGGSPYQSSVSSPGYFPIVVQSSSDVLPSGSADPALLHMTVSSDRIDGAGVTHIPVPTSLSTVTGSHNAAPVDVNIERGQTSSLQIHQSFAKQSGSQGFVPKNVPTSSSSQVDQVRSVLGSIQEIDRFSLGRASPLQNSVTVALSAANGLTDFGSGGRGWVSVDKLRPRLQIGVLGNGTGNSDVLTEQNRGPRTNRFKNHWTSPMSVKAYTTKAGSSNALGNIVIYADHYNREDFPVKYPDAKFFVIKSYSEDDVHKSIKYNVWSSTPNGNKRLDSAYEDAQRRSGGKLRICPVFLFFSVNASGQFCGVAEMIGPVDFHKDMDFWQQDKWSGSFPVKWHVIKDVPNSNFRHIILENNENKPVTNSRDTQEIKYMQGIEMLNIFKNYALKTSLLDDFMFYEDRQRVVQEKKSRLLSKSNEGLYILPPFVPPSKPSNSIDQQTKPKEIAVKHEDVNDTGKPTSVDGHVISKIDAADSSSKKATQQIPPEDANDAIPFVKIGSLSIDPNKDGTINSGAVNSGNSVLKIDSLSVDTKGGGTNKSEAIKLDTAPVDVVTVGSMPVRVNGFSSPSGILTVGTIRIDPEALKLNNKQGIFTNRSTAQR